MIDKYRFFIENYREIAKQGIARFQDQSSAASFFNSFTNEDFVQKLYVPVKTVTKLKEEISRPYNGGIIALCGPSGSGKSTTSIMTIDDLRKDEYSGDFIIFLDARIDSTMKDLEENDDIKDGKVRKMLLNSFQKEYPDLSDSTTFSKEKLELYYFLLSAEPKIIKMKETQIYDPFRSLMTKCSQLFLKNGKPGQTFHDWYWEKIEQRADELLSLQIEAHDLIDVAHYVEFSIKYLGKYQRLIVWVDNIDAYSNWQQQKIVQLLHDIQINILNYSILVVCVREENIYRIGAFQDLFNEPFVSQITFADPEKSGIHSPDFGAINVPVMDVSNLKLLTKKKLEFTFERYNSYIDFNKNLFKTSLDATKLTDQQTMIKERTNALKVMRDRKFNEDQYKKYETLQLSQREFEALKKLSDKIIESFDDEKIIFLANNSLKHFQQIHADFLLHTIENTLAKNPGVNISEKSKTQLTTEMMSWIHMVNKDIGLETFNVFDELGVIPNEQQIKGCILSYLILTRIWNETIRLFGRHCPNNNPYVRNIINDLHSDFGYSEEDIKATIFNLYKKAGGRANLITFRSKEIIESPEDIDMQSTVRVTYRGKATLGHVINSYGYLLESLERIKHFSENGFDLDGLLFAKLCKLAELHLTALLGIRNKFSDVNWFSMYLYKYGIPLDITFVRNHTIGRQLNARNNSCLYLESVFDSLLAFFRHPNDKNKMVEGINRQFNQNLTLLIENKPISKIIIEVPII